MAYVSPSKRVFVKGCENLYRRLSVRECARIQTFPDSFKFIYSDVADGYKMVGNAVPPRLAWYLAIQMKKAFASQMLLEKEEREAIAETRIKQVPLKNVLSQYKGNIINNVDSIISRKSNTIGNALNIDLSKRVLLCLVKPDNIEHYIDQTASIYYTGKKFPSCIALNKLFLTPLLLIDFLVSLLPLLLEDD